LLRLRPVTATLLTEAETETETGDSSLEGKFVNLVDLLLPVPIKGEFDVNKIKSSLYFFS
jgi:DNA-directed RNA polymerase